MCWRPNGKGVPINLYSHQYAKLSSGSLAVFSSTGVQVKWWDLSLAAALQGGIAKKKGAEEIKVLSRE